MSASDNLQPKQMKPKNYYSAQQAGPRKTWQGWVQHGGSGKEITVTPRTDYKTRAEAIRDIKAQHPD